MFPAGAPQCRIRWKEEFGQLFKLVSVKLLFTASCKCYFGIETHGEYEVVGEWGKAREHLRSILLEAALG